uniref:Uncharacterized protein n=1 Tax=Anguilla anguilla TaxID=7936 RepID=A0A0E9XUP9_ANGAN
MCFLPRKTAITFTFLNRFPEQRLLSILAPRWWNDLPVEARTAETLTHFKRRLKTHLFRLHLSPSLPTSL